MGLADKLSAALGRPKPQWRRRPEVLLSPQTAKPVHGLCPRVVLGQEWWDRTRKDAYASTDFHCIACGVSKYDAKEVQHLEGHEVYETDYLLGRVVYVETVPLCHYCHCYIHAGRLEALVGKGQIPQAKLNAVLRHGQKVLKGAGLRKPTPYTGPTADWADWRLVIGDKEYPPLYKSYEEWLTAHGYTEPTDEHA